MENGDTCYRRTQSQSTQSWPVESIPQQGTLSQVRRSFDQLGGRVIQLLMRIQLGNPG
jgi:hypothetical protein